MQQRTVRFAGRVQGVGFRATAREIALRHGLRGWVKNEPDGGVLLVAQGEPAEIDRYLAELRRRMSGKIESEHAASFESGEPFEDFRIRI